MGDGYPFETRVNTGYASIGGMVGGIWSLYIADPKMPREEVPADIGAFVCREGMKFFERPRQGWLLYASPFVAGAVMFVAVFIWGTRAMEPMWPYFLFTPVVLLTANYVTNGFTWHVTRPLDRYKGDWRLDRSYSAERCQELAAALKEDSGNWGGVMHRALWEAMTRGAAVPPERRGIYKAVIWARDGGTF